jgi:hypothetical protein
MRAVRNGCALIWQSAYGGLETHWMGQGGTKPVSDIGDVIGL